SVETRPTAPGRRVRDARRRIQGREDGEAVLSRMTSRPGRREGGGGRPAELDWGPVRVGWANKRRVFYAERPRGAGACMPRGRVEQRTRDSLRRGSGSRPER